MILTSLRSTGAKVGLGFALGAMAVGTIATAVTAPTSTVKACVDTRTQAMYMSVDGTCSKTRTLVDIGTGSISVKSIAAAVAPSVVSINVVDSTGSGTGSGSIIRTSATVSYVLTNNHVVESAVSGGTITVEFNNGDTIGATIVGRDTTYDLAVIKINKGNLPVIAFGDSSKLSVGDPVVAIGSPLGLASTVTSGIISAMNRPVTTGSVGSESYIDAIQTDAAINPGNSGGALLDAEGKIIGVNSAIATLTSGSTSGSIGLGFSIPINQAKRIATEIIDSPTHASTRPFMGISFDSNYTGSGAKILSITPGEAADKAGIVAGTIIHSVDGLKISDVTSAIVRIRSYAPGAVVTLIVELPSGASKTLKLTLGSAPSN
ncbi:MAG: trypsin-like serine protease [Actinobacteria bacterium]|nr:trypsin-like peptidase domain-containing protein [Actinomycetota bacterium]MSW47710.1 trypsin-like serine protease [Actinomycetota bacterium]MSX25229.1 trypsin-like serine protease [Actinomycetota bacterium]MSY46453.1 trypsin-like serine protease [Actinomycetota bacterium]MSY57640.1 trypsin-like serine protease [Actinomycetota bacterium]